MNAEIISVGTELLLGQVVNLDTAIVAQELSGLGINLLYSAVVGDNVERLRHAVDTALSRSDLLIMTGGLGPTTDDLTKETTAACAGKRLVLHQESLARIQNYFNEKHVSENQEKQAWLPEGCHVFQNDNGTAPGCAFQAQGGCTVIMLPGPPSELTPMLKNYVVPYLKQGQEQVIVSHNVHIYGRGEAPVAQMMDDLMDGENPTLAPYAKEGECYLRVTARARTVEEADALCQPLIEEIRRHPVGGKRAAPAAAVDHRPLPLAPYPHGHRFHNAPAVGRPVPGLQIHVQAGKAVGAVVAVIAAGAFRRHQAAAYFTRKALPAGMGFVVAFFKLLSLVLSVHGVCPPEKMIDYKSSFGRRGRGYLRR